MNAEKNIKTVIIMQYAQIKTDIIEEKQINIVQHAHL